MLNNKHKSKRILAFTLGILMLFPTLCSGMITVNAEETAQTEAPVVVPQIRVTTENGNGTELQKEDGYVKASISITDSEGYSLSDSVEFKVRGNTTACTWITKKAFTFKFSKKKDVLGMGKGKKWALIANAFDPTLLRNYITFSLGQELEIPYTSNQRYAELWVDDSYRGCYTLYEPVQEGKDRVDIDIESNNGMNDFLIEFEASRTEEGVTYFTVPGDSKLRFIASEPEEPDEEQLNYIVQKMKEVVIALKKNSVEEIGQKIDLPSFTKYYLLNEFVKPHDFDMSSVFFYYKDGKLYAGPPWDYDLSAGNQNGEGLFYRGASANDTQTTRMDQNLYKYLYNKQWFLDLAKEEYKKHSDYFANIYSDGGQMDTLRSQYGTIFGRNFTDTPWKINRWWINIQKQPLSTYQANYDYLKAWYTERDAWLVTHLGLTRAEYIVGDTDGNREVNINDVTAVQKLIARLITDTDGSMTMRACVSGNALSINEATSVQRMLAGIENPYNIGSTKTGVY